MGLSDLFGVRWLIKLREKIDSERGEKAEHGDKEAQYWLAIAYQTGRETINDLLVIRC